MPAKRFEYKIVDVADKTASEKLKKLVSERYRAIAIVAPGVLVMERGSEDVTKVDEYRIWYADSQHLGPELTKIAVDGFRIATAGASTKDFERSCRLSALPVTSGARNTRSSRVMTHES